MHLNIPHECPGRETRTPVLGFSSRFIPWKTTELTDRKEHLCEQKTCFHCVSQQHKLSSKFRKKLHSKPRDKSFHFKENLISRALKQQQQSFHSAQRPLFNLRKFPVLAVVCLQINAESFLRCVPSGEAHSRLTGPCSVTRDGVRRISFWLTKILFLFVSRLNANIVFYISFFCVFWFSVFAFASNTNCASQIFVGLSRSSFAASKSRNIGESVLLWIVEM